MNLTFRIEKVFYVLFIIFYSIGFSQQLKPNQLRISGRNLLDGNGQVIRLVGVNHAHAWWRGYLGSALQGIKSWGANSVRVVLTCGHRWPEIPADEVSTIISLARSLGYKAIVLEVHDTTGYGDDSRACDLQTAVNYWIKIKNVLDGHEDFVIINIGNEPWGNYNTSGWVDATKTAIQSLRNAGFTHVIMVDAPCWGQDWQGIMRANATNVLSADRLNNTILSVHMYEVYGSADIVRAYMRYYYDNNLPLCVGEFGHYHNGREVDEQAIVNYAKEYGISIWGWSWCGNGGGYEYLDMVQSWDPNRPTRWGSWFKSNALADISTPPQTYYSLTVRINPLGSGSVVVNPPGGSYPAGTQVTLTAQANSGYVFSNWSGDLTGTQNPVTITMNSNKVVTANFTQSTGGSTNPSSQQQDIVDDIVIFYPNENPFYLNKGDGIQLKYYLKRSLFVKLNVYDVNLKLVKSTDYVYKQPGENYFVFDGKDNDGNYLPTGLYLYQVVSLEGSKSKFHKIFIVR